MFKIIKICLVLSLSFSSFSIEKKTVISRKVKTLKDFNLGVKIFEDFKSCNVKNEKSLSNFKSCISNELSSDVKSNRESRIAQWMKSHDNLSKAYVCKDEVLDLHYHSDNPKNKLVLCFDFKEMKKNKVALIYFVKDQGKKLKINGIQY